MIFETERLLIRKLKFYDLTNFHQLESNPNVLKYATGKVKSLEDNKIELLDLIKKYDALQNNFWIYSIERKDDSKFIGTVALIINALENEIGYRFIESYWAKGYGFEVCEGLLNYAKSIDLKSLTGYVVDVNIASKKILENLNFKIVDCFLNEELQLPETKYKILL